jgi:hypothetical protein
MSPIRLSDDQLATLMHLAQPLQPQCREAFLHILARELQGRADVGDGELHRVAREVIRSNSLFDPPEFTNNGGRAGATDEVRLSRPR